MALLKVSNLEVSYGVIRAIKGISFEVNEGEIIALIGANGAGKTTILNTITGLVPAKSGTVEFDGKKVTTFKELEDQKNLHKPGDEVEVKVYRDGEILTLKVVLDEEKYIE